MSNQQYYLLLAAAIALGTLLTKIIDFLVKKVLPKGKSLSEGETAKLDEVHTKVNYIFDKKSMLSPEERQWIHDLYILHSKTDPDGIPLFYVPRSFIDTQKEIVNVLSSIYSHQEKETYILENVLKKLETIEEEIDNLDKNMTNCRISCPSKK